MASILTCPSCGAAAPAENEFCALCGTPLDAPADAFQIDAPSGLVEVPASSNILAENVAAGLSCGTCGHENPPGALFCNACGQALVAKPVFAPLGDLTAGVSPAIVPDSSAEVASERPSSDPGKRALALTLGAIGLLVALWAITWWSGGRGSEATPSTAAAESVSDGLPAVGPASAIPDGPPPTLPDTMQVEADRFEGLDTASGWYESGRYYLTAAFEARETDPQSSVQWARQAVKQFEKSLAVEENVDVRFALAEATQYDPAQPMRVVLELRTVLDEDPDHIGANFLMGERRFLIGRLDSARVSLERVLELASPIDPIRGRAEEVLAAVNAALGA